MLLGSPLNDRDMVVARPWVVVVAVVAVVVVAVVVVAVGPGAGPGAGADVVEIIIPLRESFPPVGSENP